MPVVAVSPHKHELTDDYSKSDFCCAYLGSCELCHVWPTQQLDGKPIFQFYQFITVIFI